MSSNETEGIEVIQLDDPEPIMTPPRIANTVCEKRKPAQQKKT